MNNKPLIPEEDKISVKDKVVASTGGAVQYLTSNVNLGQLWMPVMNIGYGLNPAILGIVAMILKAVDAIVDPFIGNMSDNTRSKWGRRRPYIVIGAILTGLITPFMWHLNPEWGETWMYVFVGIMGILIYACMSLWGTPYHSFLMEMTPNYDERTRLFAYTSFFTQVIALGGGWTLALVSSSWFADELTGDANIVYGTKVVSVFIGIIIIAAGVLPGLFIKERLYEKTTSHQEKESLFKSLKETMTNKAFLFLTIIVCLQIMGGNSVSQMGQYINIYYINGGELHNAFMIEGWKTTAMFVASILSIPFWIWFCEKFDKRTALIVIIASGFVGHSLNFFCLNPDLPYLQLIPAAFNSGIVGSIWLIVPSMKADVADYDEIHTGKRREGSINSVFSVMLHTSITIALGISGMLLHFSGFDVAVGTEQPKEVLDKMIAIYMIVPFLIWSLSLFFLTRYPLNRKKMEEIRLTLEERRAS
jgi:GPH family glycoside/pentoside/hexuronide:cation symporter